MTLCRCPQGGGGGSQQLPKNDWTLLKPSVTIQGIFCTTKGNSCPIPVVTQL